MTILHSIEKGLLVLDWLLAGLCLLAATPRLYVGVTAGLIVYSEERSLGGHEWTLAFGVLLLVPGGLFALAAHGMQRKTTWRWYAQLSPIPAYIVGFTLTLCLSGTTVLMGGMALCGR
jgi:uncharacterized membrane protein